MTKALANRKTTKPRKRRKRTGTVHTTRGWPAAFRQKIIQDVANSEDIVQVAYENHVHPMQVVKCIERERHIAQHRSIDDATFLQQVDRKAKAGLLLGLEGMAKSADKPIDWARLTELCRKLLEGTETLKPRGKAGAGAGPGVQINVGEGSNVNLVHMSREELQERAKALAAEIEES